MFGNKLFKRNFEWNSLHFSLFFYIFYSNIKHFSHLKLIVSLSILHLNFNVCV